MQENPGTNPDQVWNGMGVGKISGLNAPSKYNKGKVLTGQGSITYPSSYPSITVNGIAYRYAATGSENSYKEGYYTIEWFRTVVSGGANAGNNGVNPTVPYETNTFHLDGQITLNEKVIIQYPSVLRSRGILILQFSPIIAAELKADMQKAL